MVLTHGDQFTSFLPVTRIWMRRAATLPCPRSLSPASQRCRPEHCWRRGSRTAIDALRLSYLRFSHRTPTNTETAPLADAASDLLTLEAGILASPGVHYERLGCTRTTYRTMSYQSSLIFSPPPIVASASKIFGAIPSCKKRTDPSAMAALQPIDAPRRNTPFSVKCVPPNGRPVPR